VSAELAQELRREPASATRARSARARLVASLGPLTIVAGIVWAVAQPYRITLLHPHGQGLWWLVSEPPLLVVLAGVLFHVLVAGPLLHDLLEQEEDD
jgi:hypothetical protein